jgi:hypothetical protein
MKSAVPLFKVPMLKSESSTDSASFIFWYLCIHSTQIELSAGESSSTVNCSFLLKSFLRILAALDLFCSIWFSPEIFRSSDFWLRFPVVLLVSLPPVPSSFWTALEMIAFGSFAFSHERFIFTVFVFILQEKRFSRFGRFFLQIGYRRAFFKEVVLRRDLRVRFLSKLNHARGISLDRMLEFGVDVEFRQETLLLHEVVKCEPIGHIHVFQELELPEGAEQFALGVIMPSDLQSNAVDFLDVVELQTAQVLVQLQGVFLFVVLGGFE